MNNINCMDVSIIIPFYNQTGITGDCLNSIYEVTSRNSLKFEVILVDDASTEKYWWEEFARKFSNFKIVINQTNLGFACSCNRGAAETESKYLVFLNNDTIALDGWLDELIKPFETDSQVGVVGSKLLYSDNTIQHAGVVFDDDKMPFHIYSRFPSSFAGASKTREFQAVTGACLIIESKLFRDLGGFDERYLNGMEDIDLCLRVREAGRKVVFACNSNLYHLEAKTRKKNVSKQLNNLTIFTQKWESSLKPDYLKYFIEDITNDSQLPPDLLKVKKNKKQQDMALAIWGAGSEGRHMVSFLRYINLKPDFFIDIDEKKWGTNILELPIYGPNYIEEIKKYRMQIFIVIASLWYEDISERLKEMDLTLKYDSGMVWMG